MRRVLEDIKNKNFKSCYLFYGEEDFLKESYRDRLIKAIFPEEDAMNFNRFSDDSKENQIMEAADLLPFFAEKRLVVAENTGFFAKSTEGLSDYLKNVPETTVILFVEKNVDKRNACYKAVDKSGLAVEFSLPSQADLETWVLGKLKKYGLMNLNLSDGLREQSLGEHKRCRIDIPHRKRHHPFGVFLQTRKPSVLERFGIRAGNGIKCRPRHIGRRNRHKGSEIGPAGVEGQTPAVPQHPVTFLHKTFHGIDEYDVLRDAVSIDILTITTEVIQSRDYTLKRIYYQCIAPVP